MQQESGFCVEVPGVPREQRDNSKGTSINEKCCGGPPCGATEVPLEVLLELGEKTQKARMEELYEEVFYKNPCKAGNKTAFFKICRAVSLPDTVSAVLCCCCTFIV